MKTIKKELCSKYYRNFEGERELNCEEGYRLVNLYFPLEMYKNDSNLIDTVCNFICYKDIDCYYYDCSIHEDLHNDFFEFSICVDDQEINKFNKIWKEVKKALKVESIKNNSIKETEKNEIKKIDINSMKKNITLLYEVADEIIEVKSNIKNEGLDILIDYRKVITIYDTQLFEILNKKHNQFLNLSPSEIIEKYNEDLLNDLDSEIFLQIESLKNYLNELLITYYKIAKKQTNTNILGLIKEYYKNNKELDATKFEHIEAIIEVLNSEQI